MQYGKKFKLSFLLGLCITGMVSAQEIGTEVIEVTKPYTPSISKAEKITHLPADIDSVQVDKKPQNYTIYSVPVASTFTPAKGKANILQRSERETLFDNYATLGVGNYTGILGEFYTNFPISRTQNFDLLFQHRSAQGGIKDVVLENKFYDTSLDANYSVRERGNTYRLGFSALHQLYNWYGIPENIALLPNDDDIGHTFYGVGIDGEWVPNNTVFEGVDALLFYFGDSYASSEIQLSAQPRFKTEFQGFDAGINLDVAFLTGKFEKSFFETSGFNYSLFKIGGQPYMLFHGDNYNINLGAKVVLGVDTENSKTDVFFYPKISASYSLADEHAVLYGGFNGDLNLNSYREFAQGNPYVSPTLAIAPTNTVFDAYVGLNGKFVDNIGYDLKVSYATEENKAMYGGNPYMDTQAEESYHFGNSFQVYYKDVNTLSVSGKIKADIQSNYSLGIDFTYFNYDKKVLNLPDFKASLFADGYFTDKIFGGATLYFVGERLDNIHFIVEDTALTTKLDSYFDVNLHAGYQFTEQLSFFVKGNNLLGENYESWLYTPVMGLQIMGGATYKFNW